MTSCVFGCFGVLQHLVCHFWNNLVRVVYAFRARALVDSHTLVPVYFSFPTTLSMLLQNYSETRKAVQDSS